MYGLQTRTYVRHAASVDFTAYGRAGCRILGDANNQEGFKGEGGGCGEVC